MIVHLKRCHLNTSLEVSDLPVGDLFYAKVSLQIQADILLLSALINVSQHLHFLSRPFHVSLDFVWLTSTLSEGEKGIFLNGLIFSLSEEIKFPNYFPLVHRYLY